MNAPTRLSSHSSWRLVFVHGQLPSASKQILSRHVCAKKLVRVRRKRRALRFKRCAFDFSHLNKFERVWFESFEICSLGGPRYWGITAPSDGWAGENLNLKRILTVTLCSARKNFYSKLRQVLKASLWLCKNSATYLNWHWENVLQKYLLFRQILRRQIWVQVRKLWASHVRQDAVGTCSTIEPLFGVIVNVPIYQILPFSWFVFLLIIIGMFSYQKTWQSLYLKATWWPRQSGGGLVSNKARVGFTTWFTNQVLLFENASHSVSF